MAKVVHIFKSYRPIFLFEFFALWNLAFGPNQSWIRFGIKLNFKYTRADSSASTPCPLPWPTCQFPLCRCHALLPPAAPPMLGLGPLLEPHAVECPYRTHPVPPLFSWSGMSSALPLSPLCLGVEVARAPPLSPLPLPCYPSCLK
jgi:hypothetical protein